MILFITAPIRARLRALAILAIVGIATVAQAALIDVWRAEDIGLDDGDAIGSWSSASNRVAGASGTDTPILRKNATPVGGKALRFNGANRMMVSSSPVGGLSAF